MQTGNELPQWESGLPGELQVAANQNNGYEIFVFAEASPPDLYFCQLCHERCAWLLWYFSSEAVEHDTISTLFYDPSSCLMGQLPLQLLSSTATYSNLLAQISWHI